MPVMLNAMKTALNRFLLPPFPRRLRSTQSQIFNGYGQSNSQDFQLLEAAAPDPDTGSGADTATETGSAPIDSGVDDATDTGEGIPTDSGGK